MGCDTPRGIESLKSGFISSGMICCAYKNAGGGRQKGNRLRRIHKGAMCCLQFAVWTRRNGGYAEVNTEKSVLPHRAQHPHHLRKRSACNCSRKYFLVLPWHFKEGIVHGGRLSPAGAADLPFPRSRASDSLRTTAAASATGTTKMSFVSYAQNFEDVPLHRVSAGKNTGFMWMLERTPVNGSTERRFRPRMERHMS